MTTQAEFAIEPWQLGQTLMLMARDFQQRLDADLAARHVPGINARHRAVFLYLGDNGPCRAVELARAASIRPQSMMKIVHELESMGLVARREDPLDSRAKLIDFSPSGRTLIDELSHSTETVWRQYASILGENDTRRTFNNLATLLQASNTAVAGADTHE